MPTELPIISFANARAWSRWLASNHSSSRGVWLKIAKKGSRTPSVTYPEAVEAALAWGWIDGQKGKLDDAWWLQRFSPRGPKSIWSKINRQKAVALIAAGTMKPSGLAEVERAKRDGRWERAYDPQSRGTVPPDLAKALAANPRAALFFERLESYNRYAILFRVHTAKKPETRASRIEKFVEMLSRREKVHP
ncbi:MAG: YdeI/OmpD-associated family protein [Polyangiaceae bacterium]